jgi:hypothetical protein
MEASGTSSAGAGSEPPASPPAPPTPSGGAGLGWGWRILGILLALALAFACAVMAIAMADIGDTPRCDDRAALAEAIAEGEDECFEGSSAQKTISLALGWPSAAVAGFAALLALFFTATGRYGRLVLQLTAAAVALGALSILIGSV